ncbi:uncharacterized protein F4807DRAFT_462764 [Annulohypoxylon truncatum]|uniref:uncharacterized protein n=1 Tax=Annulohypoxylon truncatum TaxID=327061 RepID=UPI002008CFFB|nr:uncharacterized protein F4807DRAFT_462764 [Annulohypoxylon truncatum]KAI1207314.1 hypothetical protein F4807DRAFT_462764 [Annulohypoxylon truncatum]
MDLLPVNPSDGVVRASSIEEWFFGSKITIGQVPKALRYFNAQPAEKWNKMMEFYDGEIPPPNAEFHVYSDPIFVLKSYIWLLHKMAGGPNHFHDFSLEDAQYANAYGILNIFVAIMDGHACPVCQIQVLDNVKTRFPQLSLELVDIVFLVMPSMGSLMRTREFAYATLPLCEDQRFDELKHG